MKGKKAYLKMTQQCSIPRMDRPMVQNIVELSKNAQSTPLRPRTGKKQKLYEHILYLG